MPLPHDAAGRRAVPHGEPGDRPAPGPARFHARRTGERNAGGIAAAGRCVGCAASRARGAVRRARRPSALLPMVSRRAEPLAFPPRRAAVAWWSGPRRAYRCGGSRGFRTNRFMRHRIPVSPAAKEPRRTPAGVDDSAVGQWPKALLVRDAARRPRGNAPARRRRQAAPHWCWRARRCRVRAPARRR
jgi:hypothetical protein